MNNDMGLLSPASTWLFEESTGTKWTPEENKRFENALALFDRDTPDRWHNVASMIPGKTVSDVIRQYRELIEDVTDIEAGLIPIPGYSGNSFALELMSGHGHDGLRSFYGPSGKRVPASRCVDQERKKGVPWTEEEHRQFLLGLKKYGKGDWRNIARNFVITRTPTQVASHAQKYFIRQLSGGKDKRRSSIHDITTVNLDEITSPSPQNNRPHLPENQNRILQAQHSVDGDALIGSNYSPTSGSLVMTQFQGNLGGRYSGLDQHESHHLQSIDRISWLRGHGTAFQMHRR